MSSTNEYELGYGAMAQQFGLTKHDYGNGVIYYFPPHWKNGWIAEMHPTDGLFVASAWLTPEKTMTYTMNIDRPCMWIFCIDCGDITFTQQGKPSKHLTLINHVMINPQKPFRLTFSEKVHACFTSVLIFEDFIQNFLKDRSPFLKINIEDAKEWEESHYNTPDIMLILEQMRWGVRHADMPLITFQCKTIELLTMIMRNVQNPVRWKRKRRNYITWENKQKLYLIKETLDKDILNPPNMETMCQLSEMSESKLRLSFKNLYGYTLYDYIRTETMKRAMQLLAADELSIQNIATKCGYQNPAKFTAAFKDIHGITPSQFRKAFNL